MENNKIDQEEQNIISEDYIDIIVENDKGLKKILKEFPSVILGYEFLYNQAIIYVKKDVLKSVADKLIIRSNLSYPLLFGPMDINTLDKSNITALHNHPNLDLHGNGVLIGIVDTGIDYTHPCFINEDGTSRITSIWDQTVFTGRHPKGFKYGSEYTQGQINEALKSDDPHKIVKTTDEVGHGTFLTGIAAGKEKGKYLGAAPESEIVCVKLAPAKKYAKEGSMIFKEGAVVYQDTDILLGVYYLMSIAEKLNRPISIILGLGTTQGSHDDETYIKLTASTPGMCISTAAGNEGDALNHAIGKIDRTGGIYDFELIVNELEKGIAIYIWGFAPDTFSVSITSPSLEQIDKVSVKNLIASKYQLIFSDSTIWVNYHIAAESNGDQLAVIRIKNPEQGNWKVTLHGENIVNGIFHAWLFPKEWLHDGTNFLKSDPDYTITSIADSKGVITVGAYNHIDNHIFTKSSRGPTRSGNMKPDILAPGVKNVGPAPGGGYTSSSGTSIAAAQVAGAAALLLEWGIVKNHYRNLSSQSIRTILISGAKRLQNVSYPNNIYGYGFLDLLQSFRELNMITSEDKLDLYTEYNEKRTPDNDGNTTILGIGYLIVSVFEKNIANPLKDTKVTIKGIKQIFTTDVSGQTITIKLNCPNKVYTLVFEENTKPYEEYNIEVSMDGYISKVIDNVQIIDENTSILEVNLEKNNGILKKDIITIIPHVRWGNYPPKEYENELKVMPKASGYIVLDKVVIPQSVIVHAGVPNDKTAKNHYVAFKDYIKNVASCEIYPTWPNETIKANILAIISFTLNRVYTEWYRNKGYNFTLTSSTAHDQAFVYGKNCFKDISIIVDELFNSYITKPNIKQPLFAQYCDGKKSSCPNHLSQWGSKLLGDKGFKDIDILKQYYGSDVILNTAPSVSGIPSSYNGKILKIDSNAPEVRIIKEELNKISNNYPAIKKQKINAIYDQDMVDTVKQFQQIFHLPVDGITGLATWYKISEIYVAVSKLASL